MDWNKSQENAINAIGGTILVSAAAGSGKTAVLVERIINKIIHEENNIDIDELLIVTFSNAAATEIKNRISEKINQLLITTPKNKHLQKQQMLLDSANISTIHSFCQNLIKENFQYLPISPDFKIAKEAQIDILKHQAFTEIIDDFYDIPEFNHLLKITDATYDVGKLFNKISSIYNFLQSLPFPDEWFYENMMMYKTYSKGNISNCLAAKIIFNSSLELVTQAKKLLLKCKSLVSESPENTSYMNNFNSKIVFIESLFKFIAANNWQEIYTLLNNFEIEPLPKTRKNIDAESRKYITSLHNNFKEIINNLKTSYFCATEKDFINDMRYTFNILELLYKIILKFSEKYSELKKQKNIVDFSDLEQFAIKLLLKYNGNSCEKTDVALSTSNNFKEIFIDEYQDTNLTQEYIFKAISKDENNLFMVGDSKQSIYRFRQAMPELFIEKSNNYNNYDGINFPAKIILNENFRSEKNVTSFINFIFKQIMSADAGEIDYNEEQKLVSAQPENLNINTAIEMHILKNNGNSSENSIYNEAKYIANKIYFMVKNEFKVIKNGVLCNVKYSDFCILLRSPNDKLNFYTKAFKSLNIPIYSENSKNLFEKKEICTIISLLKILNNPFDDISLITLLFSEIFNFSPDDILILKNKYTNTYLFQSIEEDVKQNSSKFLYFINTIKYFKNFVNTMPLSKLLQKIYSETYFYNIVMTSENGKERQENLILFKNFSKDFAEVNDNSLISFIYYIDKLIEQKTPLNLSNSTNQNTSNSVNIMSIHKSKGLEFPIIILSDISRPINQIDIRTSILLHQDIGIGINKFDEEKNIKYSTIPKNAIQLKIQKNIISEELRILYVALTRAKQKLILVISNNDFEKKINYWDEIVNINLPYSSTSMKIPPYVINHAKSYEDLFVIAMLQHPKLKSLNSNITYKPSGNFPLIEIYISETATEETNLNDNIDNIDFAPSKLNENSLEFVRNNINYFYKDKHLTTTPSKLGVSNIVKKELITKYAFEKRPKLFYKHRLTSAEKGNIIHKFMQFANYENAKNNLQLECTRLLESEFISKEEYNNLDIEKLSKFFDSELYQLIQASKKVHREIKFIYPISVKELSTYDDDENSVVVQGIADCVIENENEIIIIDYKTDKINYLDELNEKYRNQLLIYQKALSKLFCKPSNKAIIYSFYLNDHYIIKI